MVHEAQIVGEAQEMTREERVWAAFYHGDGLTLENPDYRRAFYAINDELLRQDTASGDVTVMAMGIGGEKCAVEICAKQAGVAAGITEAAWLYERAGMKVDRSASDGDCLKKDQALLRATGESGTLLLLERMVVNLLQRMSGIATATQKLADLARHANSNAHIVATRKTTWGLLDKRAVHCGGGGTHRLNLGDAVLIKTNHLRLASNSQGDSKDVIEKAWEHRGRARSFEVEAATPEEAVEFARLLSGFQRLDASWPCILMLDNFSATAARSTVETLRDAGLHDSILIEASGKITEKSVVDYAAAGVDAISVGALTHSAQALDLSAKLIPER